MWKRQETHSWRTNSYASAFFFNSILKLRWNSWHYLCVSFTDSFIESSSPRYTLTDALHPHMHLFTQCPPTTAVRSWPKLECPTYSCDNSTLSGLPHGRPEESGYDSRQAQEIYFFWEAFRQPREAKQLPVACTRDPKYLQWFYSCYLWTNRRDKFMRRIVQLLDQKAKREHYKIKKDARKRITAVTVSSAGSTGASYLEQEQCQLRHSSVSQGNILRNILLR